MQYVCAINTAAQRLFSFILPCAGYNQGNGSRHCAVCSTWAKPCYLLEVSGIVGDTSQIYYKYFHNVVLSTFQLEIWMQCCSPVCIFFWINTTRHTCCQMLLLDCTIEKIFVEGETYNTPAYSLWTLQADSLETIQHSFHSWLTPNQYWFPSTKMMNPFNTSILRVLKKERKRTHVMD